MSFNSFYFLLSIDLSKFFIFYNINLHCDSNKMAIKGTYFDPSEKVNAVSYDNPRYPVYPCKISLIPFSI